MKVNQPIFDVIEFSAMSWKEFKKRYGSSIRVSNEIGKIKPISIDLVLANKEMDLYGVWYSEGGWRDGNQTKLETGKNPILIRIPVFKIHKSNDYLVVDGMHRITELKPGLILMDVVTISHKDRVYINDMMFW